MTFVRLAQADVADVTAFLTRRSEYVMFPLNNLETCGLDGDDPLAPRMWRNGDGAISDVLSVTKAGMILPYLPSGDFAAAATALRGRSLIGVIGPEADARGLQSALGLSKVALELDADEDHFKLALSDLIIPDGTTRIIPASEDLRGILTGWMTDYHVSILGMAPDAADKVVPHRITAEIEDKRRVVLMDGDTPVSTTAFNAALPHIVQIGGVYTPPHLRGRGYARRAVALHLEQARDCAVQSATLFANDPMAISAYTSVGFKQIGRWVLAIFKDPQVAA